MAQKLEDLPAEERAAIDDLHTAVEEIITRCMQQSQLNASSLSRRINPRDPGWLSQFLSVDARLSSLARVMYHLGYDLKLTAIPAEHEAEEVAEVVPLPPRLMAVDPDHRPVLTVDLEDNAQGFFLLVRTDNGWRVRKAGQISEDVLVAELQQLVEFVQSHPNTVWGRAEGVERGDQ